MAQSFQDLMVWQRAMEMTVGVYALTQGFPKEEIYGLTSQLLRASVSVASNIAEGRGRISQGEFRQFLGTAQGSNFEVQTATRSLSKTGARKRSLTEPSGEAKYRSWKDA